jgi:hypothetical protein
MKEPVGQCSSCKKDLYCLEGFFNGIILDNKELICFDCHEMIKIKNSTGS